MVPGNVRFPVTRVPVAWDGCQAGSASWLLIHARAWLWQPLDLVGLGFPAVRMRNVYVLRPRSEFQKVLQLCIRLRR